MAQAAIIAVRRNKPEIGMEELESGMEKMKLGLPRPPLEASDDKRHLSFVEAGRAVLITAAAPLVPDVLQVGLVSARTNPISRLMMRLRGDEAARRRRERERERSERWGSRRRDGGGADRRIVPERRVSTVRNEPPRRRLGMTRGVAGTSVCKTLLLSYLK